MVFASDCNVSACHATQSAAERLIFSSFQRVSGHGRGELMDVIDGKERVGMMENSLLVLSPGVCVCVCVCVSECVVCVLCDRIIIFTSCL